MANDLKHQPPGPEQEIQKIQVLQAILNDTFPRTNACSRLLFTEFRRFLLQRSVRCSAGGSLRDLFDRLMLCA
jgi:hypothetical protein